MSRYYYSREDGTGLVEKDFPFAKAPRTVTVDGEILQRNYEAEADAPPANRRPKSKLWPLQAKMSGVLPTQVPEAQALLKKHGVKCDFDKHGEPKWTSPKHQKEYCRAMGLFNKDANWSPVNK